MKYFILAKTTFGIFITLSIFLYFMNFVIRDSLFTLASFFHNSKKLKPYYTIFYGYFL